MDGAEGRRSCLRRGGDPLYTDDPADKQRILKYSPAGKVPILIDGAVTVWDSLAIIEYLAEKFPDRGLWPADAAARAHRTFNFG